MGGPLPPDCRVTLNFHPDTLVAGVGTIELLARDGEYRSQFETGTSNGLLSAETDGARWTWESVMFGGAYDTCTGREASLRPKYGALNYRADPVGGSRRFGSCHLRLRPKVHVRTTFCYPDSHRQPGLFGVADQTALIDISAQNHLRLDLLDDYVEAHVHGVLRIADDVENVILDPCYKNTPVGDAARLLPCAVEWHGGFRLSVERRADCERYRGVRAAEAIGSISKNGYVTPGDIGSARLYGMDYQTAKWAWHCVARFGYEPVP